MLCTLHKKNQILKIKICKFIRNVIWPLLNNNFTGYGNINMQNLNLKKDTHLPTANQVLDTDQRVVFLETKLLHTDPLGNVFFLLYVFTAFFLFSISCTTLR